MNVTKVGPTIVAAGEIAPALASVRVVDGQHRMLSIRWLTGKRFGRTDQVDLSPLINTHKFYAPLRRDVALFATIRIIDDGYAVAWGDGSIDMSTTSIERLAEEAMTGTDFCQFLQRYELTHEAAAAVLGRSKRQIENYLQYEALPRMVVLACIGYETRRAGMTIHEKRFVALTRSENDIPLSGYECRYSLNPSMHGWTVSVPAHVIGEQKRKSAE